MRLVVKSYGLFCDLTIASENSIFGQNGPRVGSPAGGAIVAHSANILGHKRAREMWMTCKKILSKRDDELGLSKFSSEKR